MDFFTFEPIYQERVWGGRGLEEKLGRALPADKVIGESWDVCDREGDQSVVRTGEQAGRTLRELLTEFPQQVMGPLYDPEQPFPILVKWLDCQERLSLQVHPPAAVAPELKGEPKTENWYIADCSSDAALMAGLKVGVTREQFEAALDQNQLEPLVHRAPVQPGDSLFVPSGRIHAIDAGNLILEIQQNSDTTYRVYDWGRVGLDGAPRQLHIEESLRSIDFEDYEPAVMHTAGSEEAILAESDIFRLRKITLHAGDAPLEFAADEDARLLHVVEGSIEETTSGRTLDAGDTALLPWSGGFAFKTTAGATILVTDRFV